MTTEGEARFERFVEELRLEFPRFQIVYKRDSAFAKLMHRALLVITLGAQRMFMSHYHTIIGNTLYVPERWDETPFLHRVVTLRHERVHMRQRRRYGDVLMTFLYLVPFFPLGLAYGRARIEWEAYTETLRATAELLGIEAARAPTLRAHIVQQFTSGAYGWMWPFEGMVGRWYDGAMAEIERENADVARSHASG